MILKLPWQHSAQNLRSTFGIWLQLTNDGVCKFGNLKTSFVISRISSLLSQMTRPNDDCFSCVSCSGLKTPGFSYQNLNTIVHYSIANWYMSNVTNLSPSLKRRNCSASKHLKVGPTLAPSIRSSAMPPTQISTLHDMKAQF